MLENLHHMRYPRFVTFLDLSNNLIEHGLGIAVRNCPSLQVLILANNSIMYLAALELLPVLRDSTDVGLVGRENQ